MLVLLGVFATLAVITFVSWLIESIVEHLLGIWLDTFFGDKWKRYTPLVMMMITGALGVVFAFVYQFDLIYLLNLFMTLAVEEMTKALGTDVVVLPVVIGITKIGIVITGLAIGRGSSFLHGLIKKFFKKPIDTSDPE